MYITNPQIILIGSGYLANSIINTLSSSDLEDITVYVYSRDMQNSSWLCDIGNIRSHFFLKKNKFIPKEIDWENEALIVEEFNNIKPTIIIHAASPQSMWTLNKKSKWAELIVSSGYGVTLPLQCFLAIKVAKIIKLMDNEPTLINCCYPDCVNYVLKKNNLNVFSGIGNIGIIDLVLTATWKNKGEFKILANHYNVQELMKDKVYRKDLPRLWFNEKEVYDTKEIFDKILLINDPSLNAITACQSISLIKALICEGVYQLHLPGPNGLLGGYPTTIENGNVKLIGTQYMNLYEEELWNINLLKKEGIVFNEKSVCFSESVQSILNRFSSVFSSGFTFDQTENYILEFIKFKEYLSK